MLSSESQGEEGDRREQTNENQEPATIMKELEHLNRNLLCAVDIETTGLDMNLHEIYEIAIIPLDHKFNAMREEPFSPLDLLIQPEYPERIIWSGTGSVKNKAKVRSALEHGITRNAARDALEMWFSALNLGMNKRIAPLGQNFQFDAKFLEQFLGMLNFGHYFDMSQHRDTMTLARTINDLANHTGYSCPFPKVSIPMLCSSLGIDPDMYGPRHQAMVDAMLTREIYARELSLLQRLAVTTISPTAGSPEPSTGS